jgi:hypothetical protein
VVVQHRAHIGVVVNTLTTRPIYISVALQNSRATALSAFLARLIHKASSRASRSADLDLVLRALGWPVSIEAAALAHGEEEVVVVSVLSNEGSFLRVFAVGLERERCVLGAADGLERRVLHVDGEEIGPEGAVGHDEFAAVPVQRAVDGVEVVAWLGGNACGAVVGPAVEVCAGCDADGGVLVAKS